MSRGCNQLIAQGATPINDVDEFVNHIAPRVAEIIPTLAYSDAEQMIIDLIKQGSRDGDELQAKSQLDAGLFAQTLTMLELRGAIRALGANQWSL
jgi:predicted Rossmann fold nucleotide-binding protein DprA/Smf involved in DNA uptake